MTNSTDSMLEDLLERLYAQQRQIANEGSTAPNGVTYVNQPFVGVRNGAVLVGSNVPVFTSQRSLWGGPGGSFEEEPGARVDQLSADNYFTYYDAPSSNGDWILVGNPNSYEVTARLLYHGQTQTANIPAGGHWYAQMPGAGGPVEVKGINFGNGMPAPVLTSQRTLWLGQSDFNEVLGIPYPE